MNCTWPMAPAHEPRMRDTSMSPRLRISSAANSSPRKNAARRGSHASVASAAMVGRTPLKPPKFDSMPQMAAMIGGGTP